MSIPNTRRQIDTLTSFLVLLYGTLEYDGRVQRMIEILQRMGEVTVVDIASQGIKHSQEIANTRRINIHLPKLPGKITRHFCFWWAAARLAMRAKPSVVIAEDYYTLFPGWLSAKLCSARLVYDAHELIIPNPGISMSKRERFWYLLEKWTVHRADLVIAANEDRASFMAEHNQLKQVPTVMRNIPSGNEYKSNDDNTLKQLPALAARANDEVRIFYQGDVSLNRGIGRFAQAMRYLPSKYRLIVAGDGPDLNSLKEQVRALEQEGRFTSLGRVPRHLLPAISQQATVGIITYPFQGLNNIYCSPNKIFEYAQAGLPVVATDQPPLRKWIESYGIGELAGEHDSPEKIAGLIQQVAENKNKYAEALPRFLEDNRWENEAVRVQAAIACIL
jgi:glycosyltransferase involved in cell wall biosynthesis